MAGYIFSTNQIPMMSLPQAVADRFLGIATGGQIKVILCLFRFQDMPLTKAEMAKQCNITEEDVADAIEFWIKSGLIIRRGANLTLSSVATEQPQTLPRYEPENILEKKTEDINFSYLVDEVQRVLGKTVNHNDASVILAMYDHMGMSPDLILQIINYCTSIGKTNFRYIEKVAVDWYDRGIDSFEKAETLIRNLERKERAETAISTYFGISSRALSKKEKEFIDSWINGFGMSLEMIKNAYEICIDKKAKLSFSYINGIIADWYKKGFKRVSDIKENTSSGAQTKSYDDDEISRALLEQFMGEN